MGELTGLLAGRYQVLGPLAEGAQSRVHRALDTLLGVEVVLKEVRPGAADSLRGELAALGRLRHPNLVQVIDLLLCDGRELLVQSLADGPDFVSWARLDPSPERICLGAAAALRGLVHIHQRGVVHRDLKPEHIRVGSGRSGTLPAVRLIDFGLASSQPLEESAGTLGYAAPELLAGQAATPASDLFSLGVVLHEALFGQRPELRLLDAGPPTVPESAAALREVMIDLLDPRPAARPGPRRLREVFEEIAGRSLELTPEERRGPYAPRPPLVGRDEVLARIERGFHEVAGGGGPRALQLLGCGKSTVAREAALRARLAGLQVFSLPGVLALARIGSERIEPEQLATRGVDALLARAAAGPALLVDLDGSDPEDPFAGPLVQQLRRAIDSEPRVAVLWSGELPSGTDGFEVVRLAPLAPGETAALVRGMLEGEDPGWTEAAQAATLGDPRLLVELVRAQLDAGLPETLVALPEPSEGATRRLAGLGAEEQRLLGLLACASRPLPHATLARLAGPEADALPGLLARGLVIACESGVAPADAHLGRAIRSALDGEPLRELHRRLARSEEVCASDPELIGHHLLEAGEVEAAARELLAAAVASEADLRRVAELLPGHPLRPRILEALARRLRARGELAESLALTSEIGEQDPEEGALLRAELLLDAGRPAEALAALGSAELAPGSEQHPGRLLLRARAHFLAGDHEAAASAARLGLGSSPPAASRGPLCNLAGLALVYSGHEREGLELLGEAEGIARANADRGTLARVLSSRGIALQRRGELAEAARAFREGLALGRELGDLRLSASCTQNLGTLAHRELDLDAALAHYRSAATLAHRGRLGTTAAWAAANEANLWLLCGDLELAGSRLDLAEAAAREAGAPTVLGHLELYRSELRLARGELEEAAVAIARARELLGEEDSAGRDAIDLGAGELALRLGDRAGARGIAAELAKRIPWESPDRWRAHLLAGRAALSGDDLDHEEAATELTLCLALARRAPAADRVFEAHAALSKSFEALGRDDEAAFHARRALELLEELRRRVPPATRACFDRRLEVLSARAQAARLPQSGARGEPSPAELQRLLEINKDLNQPLPLDRLLERILDGAVELTGAERGFALLLQGDRLSIAASRNVDGEAVRRGMDKFSKSIARQAIAEDAPVLAADAQGDERFRERLSIHGLRLRAVLCVPLRVRGTVRGALYVDNRFQTDAFKARHARLMEAFADQAGIALENARLLAEAIAQGEALATAKAESEALARELESRVARQSQELSEISVRLHAQEEELVRRYRAARIVGRSKAMRELYLKLDRVAEGEVPVLICGESGTGKELVARAIHYTSPRRDHPFVSLNCGAVPASLLESELFGHARGAFTGALRDRPGLFEVAGAGTLLLDEVGDMPAEMQVKLLRILQEGSFRRLGEERERASHCRVLSASHRRLAELVTEGRFREDLYYRLDVLELEVPPLRERREDIPLLVEHILASVKKPVTIAPRALAALLDHDWPGNVRQLENELQRAALLCDSRIEPEHLTIPSALPARRRGATAGLPDALRDHERRLIRAALDEAGGNVTVAASRLGLHRVALHRKMRKLGIARGKA